MKKFELILQIIALTGIIMKFNLMVGGTLLIFFSITTLMLFYYLFGIGLFNEIEFKKIFNRDTYVHFSIKKIFGSIGAGISLGAICAGILFKLLYYPGDQMNLLTGLAGGLLVTIIAFIKSQKSNDVLYRNVLRRMVIIGGVGLILFFTPRMTLIKFEYRNHPKYVEAYEDYMQDPHNKELQERLDVEYKRATVPQEVFEQYYDEE